MLHPTWVAAGRLGAGALALLVILLVTKTRLPTERRLWGHMVVPGVVGTAVPFALFAYGEERVSSIVAGIWNATTALWVLPFAVLVYRTEKFTAPGRGRPSASVSPVCSWCSASGRRRRSDLVGQLMCGAAALCYGITIPYIKRFITGSTTASGRLPCRRSR